MRNLYQLFSERARDFLHTCERWRSGVYIVASGELKSLQSRDLSVLGGLILWCLSIWERYGRIMGFILRVTQDIFMYRYSWGPSASPLVRPLARPMVSRRLIGARQASLWDGHVWCHLPKSSVGFHEANGYIGAIDHFVQCFEGINFNIL